MQYLLFFLLIIMPAVSFSAPPDWTCQPVQEDHCSPPDFEPPSRKPETGIVSYGARVFYSDPLVQAFNDMHPWYHDERLDDSVIPWLNPAAALLYPGNGPPRQYEVGDYIGVSLGYNAGYAMQTPNPSVYQITGINSNTATGCFQPTAGRLPYVNGAALTNANTLYAWYPYTQAGCSGGMLRYYIAYYSVIPVTVTPSCSDYVWNGDEEGIDCGGSCSTSCGSDNSAISQFIGSVSAAAFVLGTVAITGMGL